MEQNLDDSQQIKAKSQYEKTVFNNKNLRIRVLEVSFYLSNELLFMKL